jgi:hypothetical protein
MTHELLQNARERLNQIAGTQGPVESGLWHAVGSILDYLEGMEAVTNSQTTPVAQETTTEPCNMHLFTDQVANGPRCTLPKGHAGWCEQETTTDAPACEHRNVDRLGAQWRWCRDCGAVRWASWEWRLPGQPVPAGSA